jgi:hypothetical protein
LRSGTRKTEVFKRMCLPIRDHEKKLLKKAAPEIAEAETRRRIAEGRLKKAEAEASRAKGDEKDGLTADAMTAAVELASMKVPAAPQLLADDVTPERLAAILSEQEGRIAVMSDEGGIFDMMAGRYSQGVPNLDVYL